MQIVIRTLNNQLYAYNTVASTPAGIRAELEGAASFLVSDLRNRFSALIPRHAVAEFIQRTTLEFISDNGE